MNTVILLKKSQCCNLQYSWMLPQPMPHSTSLQAYFIPQLLCAVTSNDVTQNIVQGPSLLNLFVAQLAKKFSDLTLLSHVGNFHSASQLGI